MIEHELEVLKGQLKEQATLIYQKAGEIHPAATEEVNLVMTSIAQIAAKLAKNEVSWDAATHALQMYAESFRLIEGKLDNELQKEQLRAVVKKIALLRTVLLGAIQLGLSAAGYGQFNPLVQELAQAILPPLPNQIK